MNRDFRSYTNAIKYRDEMKTKGYKALIEEFWDFDGQYFTVIVW